MSIAKMSPVRQPIRHYALLAVDNQEVAGIATMVQGGWHFRAEGETRASLVSYGSPLIVLLGNADLADAQQRADAQKIV